MSIVYYNGNKVDTTSTDQLSKSLLVKTVAQDIKSRVYEDFWGIFTKDKLNGAGFQWEELEVANLDPKDFDPTGAKALTKEDLKVASIYHKVNRHKTFKTTKSNVQIENAMLSPANVATMANAIEAELTNSSAIADYDAMKDLLKDICVEQKNMVICDLNNMTKIDDFIKAVKVLARQMEFPKKELNFMGFKREFCKPEDLVLIIDTSLEAEIDVDSLAGAFHMDKKSLVNNIKVVDEMPAIEYNAQKADKGLTLSIGGGKSIVTYKANESNGGSTVTGKAKAILCSKEAIVRDPVERIGDMDHNGAGGFTNIYLHCKDVLSYSPLRNAVVLVD